MRGPLDEISLSAGVNMDSVLVIRRIDVLVATLIGFAITASVSLASFNYQGPFEVIPFIAPITGAVIAYLLARRRYPIPSASWWTLGWQAVLIVNVVFILVSAIEQSVFGVHAYLDNPGFQLGSLGIGFLTWFIYAAWKYGDVVKESTHPDDA